MLRVSVIFLILLASFRVTADGGELDRIRASLVRIAATAQSPDYRAPWNPGVPRRGFGTGFVVDGHRIMTNAHVVSNARLLNLTRDGDPKRYTAKVEFIAHDCDLALLTVEEPGFFDGTEPLQLGGIPELHSTVTAYGYPIGGERMSVTRGVVSRIEFRPYSHSGLDSHLTVQIDAAINPGNSGGPVVQNGHYVGVAFQGFSGAVAQNTGYMIPSPVVQRFLTDINDGQYHGYVELAVNYLGLENPAYRDAVGLEPGTHGVVVTNVLSVGSAAGVLYPGDVLLAIDGNSITTDGHIILDGSYIQMEEIVERKFHGDSVDFDILRDGKRETVTVTLKGAWPYHIMANQYDKRPRFVLFAGLLFQPLSRNFLNAYNIKDPEVNYYYDHFIAGEMYAERPDLLVLSSILADPINTYLTGFQNGIVDTVNDVIIRTISDLASALNADADHYVIKMMNTGHPIVIEAAQISAARDRILRQYQVTQEQYLGD